MQIRCLPKVLDISYTYMHSDQCLNLSLNEFLNRSYIDPTDCRSTVGDPNRPIVCQQSADFVCDFSCFLESADCIDQFFFRSADCLWDLGIFFVVGRYRPTVGQLLFVKYVTRIWPTVRDHWATVG